MKLMLLYEDDRFSHTATRANPVRQDTAVDNRSHSKRHQKPKDSGYDLPHYKFANKGVVTTDPLELAYLTFSNTPMAKNEAIHHIMSYIDELKLSGKVDTKRLSSQNIRTAINILIKNGSIEEFEDGLFFAMGEFSKDQYQPHQSASINADSNYVDDSTDPDNPNYDSRYKDYKF